ncbi:podocalyxin isoform X2 [Syngnathoides biaculeatus]|uniref:podocalyxin isoform X2 n=1 Tax=Syngnathoides biaculeatus TaxID=300417 RepID=UPI002ADD406C|nr:podocalyxin isoform X2 [Syngnathoides biaculeatus]
MGAAMTITWLLFSLSLLCHKTHSDVSTAATGVTVAKDPPTQRMTASPSKAPTVPSKVTIPAVVQPVTNKPQTVASTSGNAGTVTQAAAVLPPVSLAPAVTAPIVKTTLAPSQSHQPQTVTATAVGIPSAVPTLKSASPAPMPTARTPDTTLTVAPRDSTQTAGKKNDDITTVKPTVKASTYAPTANHQLAVHTTVILKTTQREIQLAQSTPTTPQRTTNPRTNKPAVMNETTTLFPVLAPTTPSAVVTTSASTGAIFPEIITTTTTTTKTTTTALAYPKKFSYSLNSGQEEEEKDLVEVCRHLMGNLKDGNCTLTWRHHKGKLLFDCVEINGKVKTALATQYYEEITKKPTDNKTLIAILGSCGALLIMIIILAVCASHHRKPYSENQQHLTEELHTVENGYHDNPTLEVMEVQPEMQEKKVALNGEFSNDGWIVPMDNLLKEDVPDEEDTHL